jgi:ferrous iron transport protein A
MFPVGLLGKGEKGQIVEIRGDILDKPGTCCDCRVEELGLRVGKIVEMLTTGGFGPLLLKVDESRIAIARGMAMRIMVRRQ